MKMGVEPSGFLRTPSCFEPRSARCWSLVSARQIVAFRSANGFAERRAKAELVVPNILSPVYS
jgi:hypothetical protein